MKPVIGLMPLWDEEKDSYWMLPGYVDGVMRAGGLPVMLPLSADREDLRRLCDLCDGFLFTGGPDVDPGVYGEEALPCVSTFVPRDDMERIVLDLALAQDKPVLGICRGIQFLNAALGGTLYQDLPAQHPSDVPHVMKPPYDRAIHTVRIEQPSPLYDLLGKEMIGVNTYHHQAVRELAPCLTPMAVSEDGLVEAVYMPDKKYVWAVQWHPEFMSPEDEEAGRLFTSFVDACRKG